jgi:ADP-heptose:LPS heptosyltransferase
MEDVPVSASLPQNQRRYAQPVSASRYLMQRYYGGMVNLVGQTSLPVPGAVIARFAAQVTNDSGPAHIAYALQTPTVTLLYRSDTFTALSVHAPLYLLPPFPACTRSRK